jgi:hypothetical protein
MCVIEHRLFTLSCAFAIGDARFAFQLELSRERQFARGDLRLYGDRLHQRHVLPAATKRLMASSVGIFTPIVAPSRDNSRASLLWFAIQIPAMSLQLTELVKRIDPGQLASVDQGHKKIPYLSAVPRLVEQGVLAKENRFLQRSFTKIVVQRQFTKWANAAVFDHQAGDEEEI